MEAQVQKNIRAATLLWMASVLLSRVMGFLREVIIARQAGANAQTDVFFAAFTIPDFVNYLMAGGALSITFIPIFAGYLADDKEEEGWRVFSIITTFLAVVLGIGIVLAMIFTPQLARLVASGFSAEQQEQLVRLTRIILPAQFFHFQGFLLSAVQMAKGQHRFPALSPLIYNAGIIAGGLLLGPHLGIEGFSWGVLAGALVGPFLVQIYGARKVGLRWQPILELRNPGFRKYITLSLPIMLGQSLVAWDEWLTRYFGSYLTAASISWLNYGRKLAMVPQAVFAQAAGAASYPYLARQAAEGRVDEVFNATSRALRGILLMALGTQVFLIVLANEITFVLFRSEKFGMADVTATAQVLMLFSLGIVAWSMQGMVARGYYAFQDTLTPTALGTVMTVASVPLYAWLSRTLGHTGLALGSSIAITVYAALLYLGFVRKVKQKQPGFQPVSILPFLLRLLIACGVTIGVAYGVRQGLMFVTGEGSSFAGWLLAPARALSFLAPADQIVGWALALTRGVGVVALGGPLLVVACLVFGVDEIRDIVTRIARKVLGARRADRLLSRFGSAA